MGESILKGLLEKAEGLKSMVRLKTKRRTFAMRINFRISKSPLATLINILLCNTDPGFFRPQDGQVEADLLTSLRQFGHSMEFLLLGMFISPSSLILL